MKNKVLLLLVAILFPLCVFAENQGDDLSLGKGAPAILGIVNEGGASLASGDNKGNYLATTKQGAQFIGPMSKGGLTTYHLVSANTTNATVVKNSAGQVYGWYIYNSNASARKLVFHNASSTPTAGASIFFTVMIPGSSAANVFSDIGIAFSTGIAITTVTDLTDAGTTAVGTSDLNINLFYK